MSGHNITAPLGRGSLAAEARLVPGVLVEHADLPGSWAISHGLGGPAGGTYTEVAVPLAVDADGVEVSEHVVDSVVRAVAVALYGTAWAFHYRPEQVADGVHRYGLRRRERVLVTGIEVWDA